MKKVKLSALALVLVLCFCASACGGSPAVSSADSDISVVSDCVSSADVLVTIVNAGQIVVQCEPVAVYDNDRDGALTISDALFCAHAQYCDYGADGYSAESGEYGISLTKLWGSENGGSYGYCLNNTQAFSLADTVSDGDYIVAYSFSDLSGFSDVYSWFEAEEPENGKLTLTLYAVSFDENWSVSSVPVEGAKIYDHYVYTGLVTDADGRVSVDVSRSGEYAFTAVSDSMTLVTPVYEIIVD